MQQAKTNKMKKSYYDLIFLFIIFGSFIIFPVLELIDNIKQKIKTK